MSGGHALVMQIGVVAGLSAVCIEAGRVRSINIIVADERTRILTLYERIK